jgi:hypothetical protein
MVMSEWNVNHLDALLQVGLNHGLGVRGMMELLDWARKILYKPRNFTDEEMSCRLLFLQLGGACVASLTHQNPWHPNTLDIAMGWLQSQLSQHTEHIGLDFCSISDAFMGLHGEIGTSH